MKLEDLANSNLVKPKTELVRQYYKERSDILVKTGKISPRLAAEILELWPEGIPASLCKQDLENTLEGFPTKEFPCVK